jgi:hypothetical protein
MLQCFSGLPRDGDGKLSKGAPLVRPSLSLTICILCKNSFFPRRNRRHCCHGYYTHGLHYKVVLSLTHVTHDSHSNSEQVGPGLEICLKRGNFISPSNTTQSLCAIPACGEVFSLLLSNVGLVVAKELCAELGVRFLHSPPLHSQRSVLRQNPHPYALRLHEAFYNPLIVS